LVRRRMVAQQRAAAAAAAGERAGAEAQAAAAATPFRSLAAGGTWAGNGLGACDRTADATPLEGAGDDGTGDDSTPADQDVPAAIQRLVDDLQARGWLDEARVAEALLHSKAARYGSRRLQQSLQSKGLPPDLVASSLQQARGTELARATEVWRRRFGAAPADAAERARQMRFLAGRGFEAEVIHQLMRGLSDAASDAAAAQAWGRWADDGADADGRDDPA
jgi:regulatory protein